MDCLVASGSPAGALLDANCVIRSSDQQPASIYLLEVTFHTEIGITGRQQLRID